MAQLVQGWYQAKETHCWSGQTRVLPSEGSKLADTWLAKQNPWPLHVMESEQQQLLLYLSLKFNRSYRIYQIQIFIHHSSVWVVLAFLFLPELYTIAIKHFHLLAGYCSNSNFKDTQLCSLHKILVTPLWTSRLALEDVSSAFLWVNASFVSASWLQHQAAGCPGRATTLQLTMNNTSLQALGPGPSHMVFCSVFLWSDRHSALPSKGLFWAKCSTHIVFCDFGRKSEHLDKCWERRST